MCRRPRPTPRPFKTVTGRAELDRPRRTVCSRLPDFPIRRWRALYHLCRSARDQRFPSLDPNLHGYQCPPGPHSTATRSWRKTFPVSALPPTPRVSVLGTATLSLGHFGRAGVHRCCRRSRPAQHPARGRNLHAGRPRGDHCCDRRGRGVRHRGRHVHGDHPGSPCVGHDPGHLWITPTRSVSFPTQSRSRSLPIPEAATPPSTSATRRKMK